MVHAEVLEQHAHVTVVEEGLEAGHVCNKTIGTDYDT